MCDNLSDYIFYVSLFIYHTLVALKESPTFLRFLQTKFNNEKLEYYCTLGSF